MKSRNTNNLNFRKSGITQKKILDLKKSFLELSSKIGLIKQDKQGRIEDKISRILIASDLTENDFKLLHSFFALIKKKLKEKS